MTQYILSSFTGVIRKFEFSAYRLLEGEDLDYDETPDPPDSRDSGL